LSLLLLHTLLNLAQNHKEYFFNRIGSSPLFSLEFKQLATLLLLTGHRLKHGKISDLLQVMWQVNVEAGS